MSERSGKVEATTVCAECASENIERLPLEEFEYRCLDCSARFDAHAERLTIDQPPEGEVFPNETIDEPTDGDEDR